MRLVAEGVTLPDDIDDAQNGQLPQSVLVTFRSAWQLHRFAAPLFEAFFRAAKAELGFDLTLITGSASALRTYNRQVAMFYERHVENPNGNKTFAGKRWSLRTGKANAAVPVGGATLVGATWVGSSLVGGRWVASLGSNHGWGVAADICHMGQRALSTSDRQRLQPIGARFGLKWTALPSENWHVAAIDAQRTHAAIFGSTSGPVAPAPPTPAPPAPVAPELPPFVPEFGMWGLMPLVPHVQRPDLIPGSGYGEPGNPDSQWVKYVQGVLRKMGYQQFVSVTGFYDELTKAAVADVQRNPYVAVPSDGVVNADDWRWVDAAAA